MIRNILDIERSFCIIDIIAVFKYTNNAHKTNMEIISPFFEKAS